MSDFTKIEWGKWFNVWTIFCLDATEMFLDEIRASEFVKSHLEDLKSIGRSLIQDNHDSILAGSRRNYAFDPISLDKLSLKFSQTEIEDFIIWIKATFLEVDENCMQNMEWADTFQEIEEKCSRKDVSPLIIERQHSVLCPIVLNYFISKNLLRKKIDRLHAVSAFSQDDQEYIRLIDYIYSHAITSAGREQSFEDTYTTEISFIGTEKNIETAKSMLASELDGVEMTKVVDWAFRKGFDVNVKQTVS